MVRKRYETQWLDPGHVCLLVVALFFQLGVEQKARKMGATSQLRRVLCFAKSGQSNKNRQTRVSSGYLSSIVQFARGALRHAAPLVTGVNRLIRFHREIVSHNRLLLMRQLHRADCHFVTRKNIAMGPSSPSRLLFLFYDSLHSSVDPRSTNIKGSWKRCLSVGFFFWRVDIFLGCFVCLFDEARRVLYIL